MVRRRGACDRRGICWKRPNYQVRLAIGRSIGGGIIEGQAKTLGLHLKSGAIAGEKRLFAPWRAGVCVRHSVQ